MNLTTSLPLIKLAAESLDAAGSPDQILMLISRGNPYDEMFFSNLSDPQWIPLLKKGGFFSKLPSPITAEGTTRFPRSVPLVGLLRLAKNSPTLVIEILESLPEAANPQVDDQIMRCIGQVEDPSLAQRCLPILKNLLEKDGLHDWIWIGEILKSWIRLGATAEAVDLIEAYIRAQIRRQRDRYGSGNGWQFSEIDREIVEPLVSTRPLQLATVFFNALCLWKQQQKELIANEPTAIDELFADLVDPEDRDVSTYWLEDFRQRSSYIHELEEVLATRLYEIGLIIFGTNDELAIREFDELLRSDCWELFSRLRWQLYADQPGKTLDLARTEVLARIQIFGHYAGSHGYEMAQMLASHCSRHGLNFLTSAEVKQFYDCVTAGPIDSTGQKVVDDPYVKTFQWKQLHPIRTLLAGHALESFLTLAEDRKELAMTSYKPYSSGGEARAIEQVAPKQAAQMAAMGEEELWQFLNEWKPEGNQSDSDPWWIEEHVSALGPKFSDLMEAEPERFQASTEWWRHLKRSVVLYKPLERAAIRISSETKEGQGLLPPSENEWSNWFGLAAWIAEWGGETSEERLKTDHTVRPEDRDWNWPRIIAVKFLAAAITARFAIPAELTPEIGRLLRKFVEDPDFRLASKDSPMLEDWLTTAINSVRGTALEALLQLALHHKKERSSRQPEDWIWEVVYSALSNENQSPAVFAIMGARLHLALYLYADRFQQHTNLLLPEESTPCRHAFILAQIRYGNSLGGLFKILPSFPAAAIDCLAELNSQAFGDRQQQIGDFGGRLGTHLAFYYWNDDYPTPSIANEVMTTYFNVATPAQRGRAISDIARIFENTPPTEEHEQLFQRIRNLWDRRFGVIQERRVDNSYVAEDVHEELSALVNWLGCECHPFDWRYNRVLNAICLLEKAPKAAFTVRTLELLSRDPQKLGPCIEILEALLSKQGEIVAWTYPEDELKPILVRGLHASDANLVARTRGIQETLLQHGLFSYLEMTSGSSQIPEDDILDPPEKKIVSSLQVPQDRPPSIFPSPMATPNLSAEQVSEIEAILKNLESSPSESLLFLAYPSLEEHALSGMLAGGTPMEIVKEWLNGGFLAACRSAGTKAGELGHDVLEALQDPHFSHQIYLVSIVISFLSHQFHWAEDVPLKDLVAIALLLGSLTPKKH